ncbi:tyrosine-type recombinase/integrase [Rhizobium rhizogenes]|uniref:tyrosine-type recombinase/integrase n=1 Tax=Rhizobium rhizogenes TaxID=359 RepID=UPI003ECF6B18
MARKKISEAPPLDPMRYLKNRKGSWHYVRRVPAHFAYIDDRQLIQLSLKTRSIDVAKLRRDSNELADDLYWQALAAGEMPQAAIAGYDAARARARALGFEYKSAGALASAAPVEDLVRRLGLIASASERDADALAGLVEQPKTGVKAGMKMLIEEIAIGDTKGMSEQQKRKWTEQKNYAADSFIKIVGERGLLDITRADANKFHRSWMDRVMGSTGEDPISGNTANRVIGNMRKLFRSYSAHLGLELKNPFDGLSFPDAKVMQREVPPFPTAWIRDAILKKDKHEGLNDQARGILFALVETGCRPSEICNLRPGDIYLGAEVPYIAIRYQEDRVIKTGSSVRDIPLIGLALAVMKRFPKGFPRYRNKETTLSATLMKHMRTQKLFPTSAHKVYSFRHSFEKRMLEAGLDFEFRQRMMGHSVDRPEYGDGGSMEWRREQLLKIALTFDANLID